MLLFESALTAWVHEPKPVAVKYVLQSIITDAGV